MDGGNQRNLLVAIALSVAILIGFNIFVEQPRREQALQQQAEQVDTRPSAEGAADNTRGTTPAVPSPGGVAADAVATREQALQATPRVEIDTPTLGGSISLVGARLDDLVLKHYRETIDPDSANIVLLQPSSSADAYFADFGWTTAGAQVPLPGPDTRWQADGDLLAPDSPVTLSWDNGEGLVFEQTYEVDENYLFTVTQRVRNSSGQDLQIAPFGLISRSGTPETLDFFILHEGLIGVFDGVLDEVGYDDARDDGTVTHRTTGGWMGITDKYWMTSLVPDQARPVTARFVHSAVGGRDKFQADFLYEPIPLAAGGTLETTSRVFAGAKRVTLLDSYADRLGIEKFDLSVDFGWFYFLTKPIFLALHWLYNQIGNFGIAILILTVGIKMLFFPLANKSYKSMAKMRKLQPDIMKLRERFSDDKQRLNQEVMALYKREGANPISGCLPVIIQIPVFFALYKVLFVTIEMRHAPFFGWIQDLSAPDPTTVLNLFGLLPWDRPELGALDIVNLGVWPLIMGLTMFLQQRLNPQPADPVQAKIFTFMPIAFTFLLAHFPAGLVIYWTWNNTLSIIQQAVIMKRQGVPFGGKQDFLPASFKAGGKDGSSKSSGTQASKTAASKPAKAPARAEAAETPTAGEPARLPEPVVAGADGDEARETGVQPAVTADAGGAAKPRPKKGGGTRSKGRSRGKSR